MKNRRPRRFLSLYSVPVLTLIAAICPSGAGPSLAQEDGQIRGTVLRNSGDGLGGVSAVINEISAATVTDDTGQFSFDNVPTGTYSISLALGEETTTIENVEVAGGATTTLEESVDWQIRFASTITVYSASRRRERIVEAPAAITSISEAEIALEGASGQIPKLLVYDYNLNTRGFNNLLTRRVQTLVDGRDTTSPVTGSQEWYTIGFLLEDITSIELVRGPSGALYGPNTFNGVLNIVTNPPHLSQGGKLPSVPRRGGLVSWGMSGSTSW